MILKVVIGRGRVEIVADIPFERLEPSLPTEPIPWNLGIISAWMFTREAETRALFGHFRAVPLGHG